MLWIVQYLWPYRSYFAFNSYLRWSLIIFWNGNWMASFMHSREGVTQENPLSIITYGTDIFPLIKNLKGEIPDVTQPWYANDARSLGNFAIIETYFNSLTSQGTGCGYYPKLSKSVLIVHLENLEARKVFVARHRFKVCMNACYLGGYIGDEKSKSDWMRERTLTWEKKIGTISETTGKYSQDIYAVVVCVIHSEWIFL